MSIGYAINFLLVINVSISAFTASIIQSVFPPFIMYWSRTTFSSSEKGFLGFAITNACICFKRGRSLMVNDFLFSGINGPAL